MGKFKTNKWKFHTSAPKRQLTKSCAKYTEAEKRAIELLENAGMPKGAIPRVVKFPQPLGIPPEVPVFDPTVPNFGSLRVGNRLVMISLSDYRKQLQIEKNREMQKQRQYGAFANFDSLNEALPSLEELQVIKENHEIREEKRKEKEVNTFKRLDQERVNAVQTFESVLKDRAYLCDPFSAISLHVKHKLEAEKKDK